MVFGVAMICFTGCLKKFDTTVKTWTLTFVTGVDLEDCKISSGAPVCIFACVSKTYSELKP